MSNVTREKIYVLADEMTGLGLKLAGIGNIIELSDERTGQEELIKLANDESVAIVIITEKFAELNRSIINKITLKPWPVIVEIEGPEGKMEMETNTLKELIRSAIGIEVEF